MTRAQRVAAAVKPSTSTVASAAGAAVSTIGLWLLETYVTGPLPPHVSAAVTTLAVLGAGLFFAGGRSADTK